MKNIKDKVSEPCFFRVTHKQMEHIKKQFQESGMKSFSAFFRQRVVHGIYLEFDRSELQNIRKTVQSSSSSINYITVRANSTKRIYDADVIELKTQLNIIQEQLRYILSLLQKVAQYVNMKRKRCTDGNDKICESCFFRVTPNEMYVIEERFKQSGMKSFSAFLRQQVVCGLHLQFDNEERIMI